MAGGRGPALGHFGGMLVQAPRPCFSGWAQSTRGGVHPAADATQPANRPGQPTGPRRGSRAGHRRAMPSLCRAARGDHLLGAARAVALLALDVDVPRLPVPQPREGQAAPPAPHRLARGPGGASVVYRGAGAHGTRAHGLEAATALEGSHWGVRRKKKRNEGQRL